MKYIQTWISPSLQNFYQIFCSSQSFDTFHRTWINELDSNPLLSSFAEDPSPVNPRKKSNQRSKGLRIPTLTSFERSPILSPILTPTSSPRMTPSPTTFETYAPVILASRQESASKYREKENVPEITVACVRALPKCVKQLVITYPIDNLYMFKYDPHDVIDIPTLDSKLIPNNIHPKNNFLYICDLFPEEEAYKALHKSLDEQLIYSISHLNSPLHLSGRKHYLRWMLNIRLLLAWNLLKVGNPFSALKEFYQIWTHEFNNSIFQEREFFMHILEKNIQRVY